ncbi:MULTISPECIES: hypothetical protein [Rahnella]|uniref:hypothetical protein n=1 Tax=Rahnella TaxID=34037 RepID=UPI003F6E16AB
MKINNSVIYTQENSVDRPYLNQKQQPKDFITTIASIKNTSIEFNRPMISSATLPRRVMDSMVPPESTSIDFSGNSHHKKYNLPILNTRLNSTSCSRRHATLPPKVGAALSIILSKNNMNHENKDVNPRVSDGGPIFQPIPNESEVISHLNETLNIFINAAVNKASKKNIESVMLSHFGITDSKKINKMMENIEKLKKNHNYNTRIYSHSDDLPTTSTDSMVHETLINVSGKVFREDGLKVLGDPLTRLGIDKDVGIFLNYNNAHTDEELFNTYLHELTHVVLGSKDYWYDHVFMDAGAELAAKAIYTMSHPARKAINLESIKGADDVPRKFFSVEPDYEKACRNNADTLKSAIKVLAYSSGDQEVIRFGRTGQFNLPSTTGEKINGENKDEYLNLTHHIFKTDIVKTINTSLPASTAENSEIISAHSYTFVIPTEPPSEQVANQLFRENKRPLYDSARDILNLLSLTPGAALGKLKEQNAQGYAVISRLIYNLKASDDGRKINEAFLNYMINLVDNTSSPIESAMLLRSPTKQDTRLEQILNSVFGSAKEGYYHYVLEDKVLVPLLSELVNKMYDKSLAIYPHGKNPVIDLVKKIQMDISKFHSLPEPVTLNTREIREITQEICDKEKNHAKGLSLKKHRDNEIIKKQKEMFAEINSKLIQYNLTVPSGMESYVFPAHLFKVDSAEALKLTGNDMIKLMEENGLYVVNPKREEMDMDRELRRVLKTNKASEIIADAIKKATDASGDIEKHKVIKIATEKLTEFILTDGFFDGKKDVLAACFNNLERLRSEETIKPDEALLIGENIKQQLDKPLEKKIAGQIQQKIQAQTEREVVKQVEKEVSKQTEKEVIKQVEKEVSNQTEKEVRKQAENVIARKAAEMAEKKMMEDLEKRFSEWRLFVTVEEPLERLKDFNKDAELENRFKALKQPASSSSSTRQKAKASTAGRVAEGLDKDGRPFTRTIE